MSPSKPKLRADAGIAEYMQVRGAAARVAARAMARADTGTKNACLFALARILHEQRKQILEANAEDLRAGRGAELDDALLDRLTLT
jgi:glutamate-5-semialdehyde dehydrogenase